MQLSQFIISLSEKAMHTFNKLCTKDGNFNQWDGGDISVIVNLSVTLFILAGHISDKMRSIKNAPIFVVRFYTL